MRKITAFLRRYPLSCLCIALIWTLCFATMPETPLDNLTLIDKWVHIVMYCGTCSVIWFEYLRSHPAPCRRALIVWAWLAPVLMSGLIELLQAYCTGGRRSGDWLDFAANSIGATLPLVAGFIILFAMKWRKTDKYKINSQKTKP